MVAAIRAEKVGHPHTRGRQQQAAVAPAEMAVLSIHVEYTQHAGHTQYSCWPGKCQAAQWPWRGLPVQLPAS